MKKIITKEIFTKKTWERVWWFTKLDFDKDPKTKLTKDDILPLIIILIITVLTLYFIVQIAKN